MAKILHSICPLLTSCSYVLIFLSIFIFTFESHAQDPNDCEGAIVICDNGPVSYSPNGPGAFDFANTICGTTEHQSAWYYIAFSDTMPPNQLLEFTLTPNAGDDYDFAMWGPDVDCDELDAAGMIRCNFSPIGTTGLVVGGGGGGFEEALTVNPGEGYYLLVDNFSNNTNGFSIEWDGSAAPYLDCNANPNCDLEADAGETIFACIGEPFTLIGIAIGGNGNETYNWKASPSSVLQFITDTSAATTTVDIPPGFGQEFEFLLTVREDSCMGLSVVAVVLTTPQEPQFSMDTAICSADGLYTIPTTSDNGIDGSWDPVNIDPSSRISPIQAHFTPTPNQGICADTTSLTFTLVPSIEPEFMLESELCESDDPYILPTTSSNGINGTWTPSSIDPDGNAGMTFNVSFTASDVGCFDQLEHVITVIPGIEPIFDLEQTICETADPILLSPISTDGFTGQWSIPTIDPAGQAGFTITSTFSPDPDQGVCLLSYTHEWMVVAPEIPLFDPFADLCLSDPLFVFPILTSDGQYFGTWNPVEIDPALVGEGTYDATFTPDISFGDCVEEVTMMIEIIPSVTPEFEPVFMCELDDPLILPTTSLNGLNGTWAPAIIDPFNQGGNIITSIFTPTSILCSSTFELNIIISEEEEIDFSLPTSLCELDEEIILPTLSDNGITGTWSIPTIDPIGQGGEFIISTFSPDIILHPCARPYEIAVLIDEALIPEFIISTEICENATTVFLENSSINGILGSWSIPSINPSGLGGTTIETIFTPQDNDCAQEYTLTVDVIAEPMILSANGTDPSDCGVNDGVVEVTSNTTDVEYSIDGGVTWEASGVFTSLGGGNYTVFVRNENVIDCITSTSYMLETPGAPIISFVEEGDITDCNLIDGEIIIHAIGSGPLEYSIDNGLTWQSDSIFLGLSDETYQLSVRELNAPACVTGAIATISAPIPISIDSIYTFDVTDCGGEDGRISVSSIGIDLEYSIDGGSSWQDSPVFDLLPSGSYEVVVRNSIFRSCIARDMVMISEPISVQILEVDIEDLTDCLSQDGEVHIRAVNGPFEYSIDDGITWQRDSTFTNLSPGNYSILTRRISAPNCLAMTSATVSAPNAPQLDSIDVEPVSDCDARDGQLYTWATGIDLEYSLDNGLTWQSSPIFANLAPNSYQIIVRSSQFVNCFTSQTFTIEELPEVIITELIPTQVTSCVDENGSIEVNADGVDLEYSIDGVTWQMENVFLNLAIGIYNVQVRRRGFIACQDEMNIELVGPALPNIQSLAIQEISDCGTEDGVVEIISTGTNLEYSIDNGSTWQSGAIFENLQPGLYDVVVRNIDFISCQVMDRFELNDPPCTCGDVEFYAETSEPNCFGDMTGSIQLSSSVDDLLFDVLWDDGQTGVELNNLGAGQFNYVISYRDNCIFEDSVILIQPAALESIISSESGACETSATGSITVELAAGGSGDYAYSLDGVAFQQESLFAQVVPGIYTVTIRDAVGCTIQQSTTVNYESDTEVILFGIDEYIEGEQVMIEAEFDMTLLDSFVWKDENGVVVSTLNPLQIEAVQSGIYHFVGYYQDCQFESSFAFIVNQQAVFFPNAFSPNNDGLNDRYIPFISSNSQALIYDIQIFNRWGGKVYERNNVSTLEQKQGWDGQFNNKKAGEGIYIYQSTVYLGSGPKKYIGEIYLIR